MGRQAEEVSKVDREIGIHGEQGSMGGSLEPKEQNIFEDEHSMKPYFYQTSAICLLLWRLSNEQRAWKR